MNNITFDKLDKSSVPLRNNPTNLNLFNSTSPLNLSSNKENSQTPTPETYDTLESTLYIEKTYDSPNVHDFQIYSGKNNSKLRNSIYHQTIRSSPKTISTSPLRVADKNTPQAVGRLSWSQNLSQIYDNDPLYSVDVDNPINQNSFLVIENPLENPSIHSNLTTPDPILFSTTTSLSPVFSSIGTNNHPQQQQLASDLYPTTSSELNSDYIRRSTFNLINSEITPNSTLDSIYTKDINALKLDPGIISNPAYPYQPLAIVQTSRKSDTSEADTESDDKFQTYDSNPRKKRKTNSTDLSNKRAPATFNTRIAQSFYQRKLFTKLNLSSHSDHSTTTNNQEIPLLVDPDPYTIEDSRRNNKFLPRRGLTPDIQDRNYQAEQILIPRLKVSNPEFRSNNDNDLPKNSSHASLLINSNLHHLIEVNRSSIKEANNSNFPLSIQPQEEHNIDNLNPLYNLRNPRFSNVSPLKPPLLNQIFSSTQRTESGFQIPNSIPTFPIDEISSHNSNLHSASDKSSLKEHNIPDTEFNTFQSQFHIKDKPKLNLISYNNEILPSSSYRKSETSNNTNIDSNNLPQEIEKVNKPKYSYLDFSKKSPLVNSITFIEYNQEKLITNNPNPSETTSESSIKTFDATSDLTNQSLEVLDSSHVAENHSYQPLNNPNSRSSEDLELPYLPQTQNQTNSTESLTHKNSEIRNSFNRQHKTFSYQTEDISLSLDKHLLRAHTDAEAIDIPNNKNKEISSESITNTNSLGPIYASSSFSTSVSTNLDFPSFSDLANQSPKPSLAHTEDESQAQFLSYSTLKLPTQSLKNSPTQSPLKPVSTPPIQFDSRLSTPPIQFDSRLSTHPQTDNYIHYLLQFDSQTGKGYNSHPLNISPNQLLNLSQEPNSTLYLSQYNSNTLEQTTPYSPVQSVNQPPNYSSVQSKTPPIQSNSQSPIKSPLHIYKSSDPQSLDQSPTNSFSPVHSIIDSDLKSHIQHPLNTNLPSNLQPSTHSPFNSSSPSSTQSSIQFDLKSHAHSPIDTNLPCNLQPSTYCPAINRSPSSTHSSIPSDLQSSTLSPHTQLNSQPSTELTLHSRNQSQANSPTKFPAHPNPSFPAKFAPPSSIQSGTHSFTHLPAQSAANTLTGSNTQPSTQYLATKQIIYDKANLHTEDSHSRDIAKDTQNHSLPDNLINLTPNNSNKIILYETQEGLIKPISSKYNENFFYTTPLINTLRNSNNQTTNEIIKQYCTSETTSPSIANPLSHITTEIGSSSFLDTSSSSVGFLDQPETHTSLTHQTYRTSITNPHTESIDDPQIRTNQISPQFSPLTPTRPSQRLSNNSLLSFDLHTPPPPPPPSVIDSPLNNQFVLSPITLSFTPYRHISINLTPLKTDSHTPNDLNQHTQFSSFNSISPLDHQYLNLSLSSPLQNNRLRSIESNSENLSEDYLNIQLPISQTLSHNYQITVNNYKRISHTSDDHSPLTSRSTLEHNLINETYPLIEILNEQEITHTETHNQLEHNHNNFSPRQISLDLHSSVNTTPLYQPENNPISNTTYTVNEHHTPQYQIQDRAAQSVDKEHTPKQFAQDQTPQPTTQDQLPELCNQIQSNFTDTSKTNILCEISPVLTEEPNDTQSLNNTLIPILNENNKVIDCQNNTENQSSQTINTHPSPNTPKDSFENFSKYTNNLLISPRNQQTENHDQLSDQFKINNNLVSVANSLTHSKDSTEELIESSSVRTLPPDLTYLFPSQSPPQSPYQPPLQSFESPNHIYTIDNKTFSPSTPIQTYTSQLTNTLDSSNTPSIPNSPNPTLEQSSFDIKSLYHTSKSPEDWLGDTSNSQSPSHQLITTNYNSENLSDISIQTGTSSELLPQFESPSNPLYNHINNTNQNPKSNSSRLSIVSPIEGHTLNPFLSPSRNYSTDFNTPQSPPHKPNTPTYFYQYQRSTSSQSTTSTLHNFDHTSHLKESKKSKLDSIVGIFNSFFNLIKKPTQYALEGYHNLSDIIEEAMEFNDTIPFDTFLNDLASSNVGGRVIFATDQWFAAAYNLLETTEPVFKKNFVTECGQWMDGWETRRRRTPYHDWCIIELGLPGKIKGFDIDTSYFTGNFSPKASVQACYCPELTKVIENAVGKQDTNNYGTCATADEIDMVDKAIQNQTNWSTLLEMTPLKPGYPDTAHNKYEISNKKPFTHVRLNMFPDGGIARFHVYGEITRSANDFKEGEEVDLIGTYNGGLTLLWSNQHYGLPKLILLPSESTNMKDGWETSRASNRPPIIFAGEDGKVSNFHSEEWCIVKLGIPGKITKLCIDTSHFKGNYPESATVMCINDPEVAKLPAHEQRSYFLKNSQELNWTTVLERTKLKPHNKHYFTSQNSSSEETMQYEGKCTHVMLKFYPDGGVARFRAFGKVEME